MLLTSIRLYLGSQVTKNQSTITVSADASAETQFEFDEPVYLHPGKMYAFTLFSNEQNTYKVWAGKVLDFDLGSTTNKITKNLAPQKEICSRVIQVILQCQNLIRT